MTCGEILAAPLTWLVVGVAFIGGLYSCKTLAGRVWFVLVMPVIYSMLWLMCVITIGSITGSCLRGMDESLWSGLTIVIATTICLGLFIIQIVSMEKGPRHRTQGYSLGKGRGQSLQAEATRLQRIPTRKRWSG
jgi:hypothetical protein